MMKSIAAAAALCAAAGMASAGTAVVSSIGGGIAMQSKDLSAIAFDTASPVFGEPDLIEIHADINASPGISTNGCITFILAEVTLGSGGPTVLSFMALVDEETGATFGGVDSHVFMNTSADGATNPAYINDSGGDIEDVTGSGDTREGDFEWDSGGKGDAFAWADLVRDDVVNFRFESRATTFPGLMDPTFQFLSWDPSASDGSGGFGAWVQLGGGKFAFGAPTTGGIREFGFSAQIIPLPTPALLGIAGLGLAHIARRRFQRR